MDKFSNLPEIIKSVSLLTDYNNTVAAISRSDPNMLRGILQDFDTIMTVKDKSNKNVKDKSNKNEKMLKELLIKKIKKPIIYNILFKAIKLMKERIKEYITKKKTDPEKLFDIKKNIEYAIGDTITTENIYKNSDDAEIKNITELFKNMINDYSKYDKESISEKINNIVDYTEYETIKDEYDSLFPKFSDSSTPKDRPQSPKTRPQSQSQSQSQSQKTRKNKIRQ